MNEIVEKQLKSGYRFTLKNIIVLNLVLFLFFYLIELLIVRFTFNYPGTYLIDAYLLFYVIDFPLEQIDKLIFLYHALGYVKLGYLICTILINGNMIRRPSKQNSEDDIFIAQIQFSRLPITEQVIL